MAKGAKVSIKLSHDQVNDTPPKKNNKKQKPKNKQKKTTHTHTQKPKTKNKIQNNKTKNNQKNLSQHQFIMLINVDWLM